MSSVIHKVDVFVGFGEQEIPAGKILHMDCLPYAEGVLQVWVQAETDQDLKHTGTRTVRIYPTGGTPQQGETHLATTVTPGFLVWHLYATAGPSDA